jgi:hypothetical protein
MKIDFDSLYEMIENMDKSAKEKCLICHLPIEEDELILSCNHYYHSLCLNKKKDKIKCPYCEKMVTTKDKPLTKPIKKIPTGCKVKLLSGKNKGEYCGRINCSYHKIINNKVTVVDTTNNICQSILKSGLKKGQACGRTNCKLHNMNI